MKESVNAKIRNAVKTDLEQTDHLLWTDRGHVPTETGIDHSTNVSKKQRYKSGSVLMRLAAMLHVVRNYAN